MENSSKSPACSCNSLANVTWSPANATALALSKFKSLPINNSASNSALIEDSKSNKACPAAATSSKLAPNNFAWVTASAIASILPPKLALTAPVTLAVSSKICLKSNWTPTCLCNSKLVNKAFLYPSSKATPDETDKAAKPPAASSLNLTALVSLVNVTKVSVDALNIKPNCLLRLLKFSNKADVVQPVVR